MIDSYLSTFFKQDLLLYQKNGFEMELVKLKVMLDQG